MENLSFIIRALRPVFLITKIPRRDSAAVFEQIRKIFWVLITYQVSDVLNMQRGIQQKLFCYFYLNLYDISVRRNMILLLKDLNNKVFRTIKTAG